MGGRAARARARTTFWQRPPPNPPATAVQSLRERTTGSVSPPARRPARPPPPPVLPRSPRRPPPAARAAAAPPHHPPPPALQVDLNRNFGFKWGYNNEDSCCSAAPRSTAGKEAFSTRRAASATSSTSTGRQPSFTGTAGAPPPAASPPPLPVAARPRSADLDPPPFGRRGNDIAYPFSYAWNAKLKPDELGLFQEIAAEMAQTNHYSYGRAWESVGYTTNGEADDWGWASEGIPSWTVEVGTSKDSFWPSVAHRHDRAGECLGGKSAGVGAGPQLQLDSVSVRPADASGKNVEVSLVWQNNGLEDFSAGHTICVPAVGGGMKAKASAGWTLPPAKDKLCHSLQALADATSHALPPLTVTVDGAATSHLEFVFAVELQASPKFAWTMVLRVRNEARTYKECDELCICPSDEALAMEYCTSAARACRRAPTAARRRRRTPAATGPAVRRPPAALAHHHIRRPPPPHRPPPPSAQA